MAWVSLQVLPSASIVTSSKARRRSPSRHDSTAIVATETDPRAHHGEMLREATRLVEAGKLQPRLDPRRFDLGSAEAAYEAMTSGTARGKIVVEVA
jgi:NADPH:quinone reductase-like Zn-dependent oxidoreductase